MNIFMRIVAGLALLGLVAAAQAQVTVYRATDYKNNTYAKISDGQWRIDPDGLSTFELAYFNVPAKRCMVSFVILGVASLPPQGTQGQVQNMPPGFIGEYTPQHGGPGHWSLQGPPGTPAPVLQAAITAYVIQNAAAQRNPTYTGTNQSTCTTPNAPN